MVQSGTKYKSCTICDKFDFPNCHTFNTGCYW